jgi:aspartate-semialdehyde dehydrogenase
MLASDAGEGTILSEEGGEPALIGRWEADELNAAQVVFFCGGAESAQKASALIEDAPAGPLMVDLTHALEERPEARLRAPGAEPPGFEAPDSRLVVVAHPAAILIVSVLRALHAAKAIQRSVVHVFEPASERGRAGVEELQKQTVNLLSFKRLPKAVFDEQLSFNLLARYGSEAPLSLASIERRVEKHTATLAALAPALPLPSLRLLQAGVMHGHSASLWVEFPTPVEPGEAEQALATAGFDVRGADVEAANPVAMANQDGIAVSALEPDRNNSRALWLFAVADNYRLASDNAVSAARQSLLRSYSR